MLSQKLKADIRKLWDRFWSGGIANPLTAIEQITYLVFLKRLEELDNQNAREAREANRPHTSIFDVPDGTTYRWSHIKQLPSEERLKHVRGPVFEWLKTIEGAEERMRDAVFVIPSANLLQGAIEIIDNLFVPSRNQDTLGDIYEMLLSEIAEAGKNGQFRTPRHIIRAMCDLVDPRYGERICDPACGTGGFIINAYQHILKSNTSPDILEFEANGTPLNLIGDLLTPEQHAELRRNHFYGFDFDRTMVRLGWMNAIQHGLDNPQINYADTLGSRFYTRVAEELAESFDVVLANPPFTGNIDKTDIGESLRQSLSTTKTELLFVELILQLLSPGGRAAVIVPEGVLFGSTGAHKALRKKLVTENQLRAVISLPGGVFQPYSGVKTSILVFHKGGKTDEVWFYEITADGHSLDAKRTERPNQNDLWDMVLKYRLRYIPDFRQPAPAFINGAGWKQWSGLPSDERTMRYAQPLIATEEHEDNEGEKVEIALCKGIEATDLEEPKTWQSSQNDLAAKDYHLSAGRYKPFILKSVQYDPPAQIIGELQQLENRIQQGLDELLAMVEGRE
jgi:type I restriction enzyme M protein